VFHVSHKAPGGKGNKGPKHTTIPVHFASSDIHVSTIKVSDSISKLIVIAFDHDKHTAFMRITDVGSSNGEYFTTESLFVFSSTARLYFEIVPRAGPDKLIIVDGVIMPASILDGGFGRLTEFIDANESKFLRMQTTTQHATDKNYIDTYHHTMFYLRHLLPQQRFINVGGKQDGDFVVGKAIRHMKVELIDFCKLFYVRDCLIAVAATMCDELGFAVDAGTNDIPTGELRAIILHKIEGYHKTTPKTGADTLLYVISTLADFVSALFSDIIDKNGILPADGLSAVKSMYRHNVSLPNGDTVTVNHFGHLLTVALLQTVQIELVSEFSDPVSNETPKVYGLRNDHSLVGRISNLTTRMYPHATGHINSTRIAFVMRKKGYIHLKNYMTDEAYEKLEPNIWKNYTIHTAFPNKFLKHPRDRKDFAHNISITWDVQTVINLTVNSPSKQLNGAVVDFSKNSL
jgi:hypothetical protein